MAGFRLSLHGLFEEIGRVAPHCKLILKEVEQHLRETIRGERTLQEFAEHYCLADPLDAPPKPPQDGH